MPKPDKTRKKPRGKDKKSKKVSLKIAKSRMISEEQYRELIRKRQHKDKLTYQERKKLDHALFLKYCSCVKTLKYKKDLQANLEYPFCMSSVYTKRGFKSPKGVTKRCKKYE